MLYLLVTVANGRSLPECVTSLPSWSCGFDSRRPLHRDPAAGPAAQQAGDRIAGQFAARVRTADKGPRLAPPELAGTIQRGNQNETRERSRPQCQRSFTLLADERELQVRIFG